MQGTVLGTILFSIMINDIRPVQASNLIVKFADDINVGIKVANDSDTSIWKLTITRSGRTQIAKDLTLERRGRWSYTAKNSGHFLSLCP